LPAARSLAGALRAGPAGVPSPRIRVIAEVKAASPSAGRLMDDDRRAGLPLLYAESGAAAISVLTERAHFQGDLGHLTEARETLQSRFGDGAPPLLRKDFLFDPYQVWESRAYGADAILLIIAILSRERLAGLLSLAGDLGLDCLVEAHDEGEVEQALEVGAEIVGVNNRDLHSFEVDLATTERMRPLIPSGRIVVAESGIHGRADVERMAACGVDAVLVGEALVRAKDTAAKMKELLL
ncbi:MAG TPA: indole-3-glycerol phosphate synthase TrpC, partial [Dehalococcoidia bacterium]|nr:indole-3-glycerol phosphate synthase TrpC [Dehalococcoidia bacterium]